MSNVMQYRSEKYKNLTAEMLKKWKTAFKEQIIKAVEEFKPDVIQVHHLWILTSLLSELVTEIPIKAICHGTGLRQLNQAEKFADYVIAGCKKVDTIFALHSDQKQKISRLYDIKIDRIKVVGSGYDSDIFYPSDNSQISKPIQIVYAGKLSYAKGLKSLIRVCSKLSSEFDLELKLVGGGSGEEAEYIKELAMTADCSIEMPGVVSQVKLGKIFRKSDIFCLASFSEGLPLVLIEALASGLLVVTTDLEGVKSWLGDQINKTGAVEYVELPELKESHIPVESELPDFESRLKSGLENQIERLRSENNMDEPEFREKVKSWSWAEVFKKMEYYF
jgi:glycosyltransferase involved in cell wall biosynthesis